jgi:sugar (pentulose or hexulose) kinase
VAVRDFILLDVGGSYIKSCTVEKDGQDLRNFHRVTIPPFTTLMGLSREISLIEFNKSIAEAIRIQQQYCPRAREILISGQMGCFLKPGGEIVSWQDRSVLSESNYEEFESFSTKLRETASFRRTGTTINPGLPLIVMGLSQNNFPKPPHPTCFTSLISQVVAFLSGDPNPIMHPTDAASSGFYDIFENAWISDLTNLVRDKFYFPEVASEVKTIAYSAEFNLEVYCGVGDQQASLLGAGIEENNVVINIGTGGQVARLRDSNTTREGISVRPYFGNKLIETITHLPAGRSLKAFVEYCTGDSDYASHSKFFELIDQNNSIGDIDIVDFQKALFEIKNSDSAVDFSGIAGSFFHSMVDSYRDAIQSISKNEDLVFAGGVGQKFELLSQRLGNELNRSIFVADSEETTLNGLSKLTHSL